MAVSSVPTFVHQIKMMEIEARIPANERGIRVPASVPTGWNFLCWVNAIPSGWAGGLSLQSPNNLYTVIWNDSPTARTVNSDVLGYYLIHQ